MKNLHLSFTFPSPYPSPNSGQWIFSGGERRRVIDEQIKILHLFLPFGLAIAIPVRFESLKS